MPDLYEYECALSGLSEEGAMSYDGDQMADCPPGWVEVTMKRRLVNPKYVAIQRTKESMIAIAAQQIPANVSEEIKQAQRAMMSIQVEATFHGIEAETPPYLTYEERVFIAPPETNPDLLEAFNEVREGIGLDKLDGTMFQDEEEQDEQSDDGDSTPAAETDDDLDEIDQTE